MTPLNGITVLDLGNLTAGPLTSWLLGSLGAEIIKIESPTGDLGRSILSSGEEPPPAGGYYFHSTNSDKRSVVLDLKTNAGREAFLKLIQTTDVVIENFRPGTMEALGLEYEQLRAQNESLIYCSITGYGQDNAGVEQGAYDSMLQALCGVMYATGYADEPPTKVGVSIIDNLGSYAASTAILGALVHRKRTGSGQSIDIALQDCGLWLSQLLLPFEPGRTQHQPLQELYPINGVFRTIDGPVAVVASNWTALAKIQELVESSDCQLNTSVIETNLARWMENERRTDVIENLRQIGVNAAPVRSIGQVLTDPELETRGSFTKIDCPDGAITIPVSPYVTAISEADQPQHGGPSLGEHTDEVLAELAGYDEDQISMLRESAGIK